MILAQLQRGVRGRGWIDAVVIIKFMSKFRNKDRAVTMTHRKIAVVDTREKIWQSIVLVSILHNLADY